MLLLVGDGVEVIFLILVCFLSGAKNGGRVGLVLKDQNSRTERQDPPGRKGGD